MFQTSLNVTQAPGIAGDFCTVNPRHSAISVPGGYIAGNTGVTVGCFAWADSATGTVLSSTGTGAPTGFIHRNLNAQINVYPSEFGMTIPAGFGVGDLFNGGDFWVKNAGSSAVTIGMKAYANLSNGTVSFAATGTSVTGSVETKWYAQSAGAAGELIQMTSVPLG